MDCARGAARPLPHPHLSPEERAEAVLNLFRRRLGHAISVLARNAPNHFPEATAATDAELVRIARGAGRNPDDRIRAERISLIMFGGPLSQ